MTTAAAIIQRGVIASRPAAATHRTGLLYQSTDEGPNTVYRCNGSGWDVFVQDGADGGGINWLGAWDSGTAYVEDDAVEHDGSSYICTDAHTDQEPPDALYWDVLAARGEDGSGSGDVVGPAASVDSEVALFDSTTGKLLKRATGTGVALLTDGVQSLLGYTRGRLIRAGAAAWEVLALGSAGQSLKSDGTDVLWEHEYSTISFVVDGGGSEITNGVKGDLEVPDDFTITRVTALADQAGDVVVDIWRDTYANYPPTDADSITASAPVTISGAAKSQDSTLTGWTVDLSAGDTLRFNVDSVADITRVTIALRVRRR